MKARTTTKRRSSRRQSQSQAIADALIASASKAPDDIEIVYDLMESGLWTRLARSLGSGTNTLAARVTIANKIRAGLPKALHATLVEYSDLEVDETMTTAFAAFAAGRAYQRRLGGAL